MNIERMLIAVHKAIGEDGSTYPDQQQLKHLHDSLKELSVSNSERIERWLKRSGDGSGPQSYQPSSGE